MTANLAKYTHEDIDLFYTPEIKKSRELTQEVDLDVETWNDVYDYLEMHENHDKLVNEYAKRNNLERIAVLVVDGKEINKKWGYSGKGKNYYIQSWIDKNDGKYKVLIIDSPNPGQNKISSKKSPVLTIEASTLVDFFLPGKGYLEPYEVDEELRNFEE